MSEKDNANTGELTGENLVFIVGSPRSGTTWLQRLLAAHPRIRTGQESRLFTYVAAQSRLWEEDLASAKVIGRGGTGMACYLSTEEFRAIEQRYLGALLQGLLKGLRPGETFLEKTPGHALCLKEITRLLPAAKIIHIVRDPHDVVASLLAASKGWGHAWAPRSVKEALRVWRLHVEAARQVGAVLSARYFCEVAYEDMVRQPEKQLRLAADFIGLTWSDEEVAAAIAANAVGELRQGRGTPIPIRGALAPKTNTVVQEPKDFVRHARPGSWRQDLTWLERWKLKRYLRRLAPKTFEFGGQQTGKRLLART